MSPSPNLCLVVEYVDGGSLDQLLLTKKNINIELSVVKQIIMGIAAGMYHLHAEGIIHRDLASRNILLTQNFQAKVSDFGMSRANNEDNYNKTNTEVGPLKWMPPESILRRMYSTKSDVFSFGVVIWEILTRQVPYQGLNAVEAAIQVATQGLRLPIPEDSPPLLAELMRMCWRENADERPTFNEICEKLISFNTL